jgi:uncharacterized protein (DUF1015 family)
MSLIQPFTALRPRPEYAQAVVAPPYDVLDTEEARARAADNPWSFLHISRPEIDFPAGTDPCTPAIYAKGRENLTRMIDAGVLHIDQRASYYVYRLQMGAHRQTGLVVAASIAAYENNRIRKHELTQPHKVNDRARQIATLNAHTGPVAMIYRHSTDIEALFADIVTDKPEVEVVTDAAVGHSLWSIRDHATITALTAAVERLDLLYIADGHHRIAAAAQVAAERRAVDSRQHGERAYDYFLGVIFPHSEMRLLEYNRVVTSFDGLTSEQFLQRLRERFVIDKVQTAMKPARAGEFAMYLPNQWYLLQSKRVSSQRQGSDRLDASILSEDVLAPILNIVDLRSDERVGFVGGIRGLTELERCVDSGEMAVSFALYPASIEQLMNVADAGQIMPPKSTWFEPKLADGLVSHVLD